MAAAVFEKKLRCRFLYKHKHMTAELNNSRYRRKMSCEENRTWIKMFRHAQLGYSEFTTMNDILQSASDAQINETERTRQQIKASAVTRLLQEQSLSAEQERFEIAASTSLLVAQAQRDLL